MTDRKKKFRTKTLACQDRGSAAISMTGREFLSPPAHGQALSPWTTGIEMLCLAKVEEVPSNQLPSNKGLGQFEISILRSLPILHWLKSVYRSRSVGGILQGTTYLWYVQRLA